MTLRAYQFGTTTLPTYVPSTRNNIAARWQGVPALNAFYDNWATDTAHTQLPYVMTYTCMANEASAAALSSTVDGLRALIGQHDRLWVKTRAAEDRWAYARLTGIDYDHRYNYPTYQPLTLSFAVLGVWNGTGHGGSWNLDAGYLFDNGLWLDAGDGTFTLDGSPKSCSVTNSGNITCRNPGITVTAGSVALTRVVVTCTAQSCELEWNGSLAPSTSLLIDCGAWSVYNDGIDAYDELQLTANHASDDWLTLAPGANTISVEKTGGHTDSTVTFTFSDTYA